MERFLNIVEVIIDLKEDKDVNNVKAYMKFNKSELKF